MKRAAILLVLPLAIVVGGHAPGAWACSCAPGTKAEHREQADVVFSGDARKAHDPAADDEVVSSGRPITWTFDVADVEKGSIEDPADVETSASGGTCGYPFEVGRRYRVYVYEDGKTHTTNLCSGNEDLGPSPDEPVSSGGGGEEEEPPRAVIEEPEPTEPDPGGAPDGREPIEEAEPIAEAEPVALPADADDSSGGSGLAIAFAAVTLGVAAGGLFLARRLRPSRP